MDQTSDFTSPNEIVLATLLALDHLKLRCDYDALSGTSVPVDIVIMPDFVVDVDGATISTLNKQQGASNGMSAPAEIGSRAGRVLSILAHLRDLDDEAFQLHYIAKTDRAGEAFFRNRLDIHLRKNRLQPVQSHLLIPAINADTRFAVLGRETYRKEVTPQVLRCTEQHLVKKEELFDHFYRPIDIIRRARAIYFATDSAKQFKELIEVVIKGGSPQEGNNGNDYTERHLVIDLSAIHDERGNRMEGISDEVRWKLNSVLPQFHLDRGHEVSKISDSLPKKTHLTFVIRVSDLAQTKDIFSNQLGLCPDRDTLIAYDKNNVSIGNDSRRFEFPRCWSEHRPNGREAFIAGVVLFKAIGAAWNAGLQSSATCKFKDHSPGWVSDFMDILRRKAKDKEDFFRSYLRTAKFSRTLGQLWEDSPSNSTPVPNRRVFLINSLSPSDRARFSFKPNILETLAGLEARSADWCCAVACLTDQCLSANLPESTQQNGFILHLKDQLYEGNSEALFVRPENWTDKSHQTKVLDPNSVSTVRVQFALQMLRQLAMHSGGSVAYGAKVIGKPDEMPQSGRQLYVVGYDANRLSFRVFDRKQRLVAAIDEKGVVGHTQDVADLKGLLEGIRDQGRISLVQQRAIVSSVTTIIGETNDIYLSDLDSTLIDSTTVRDLCLQRAFLGIMAEGEEDWSDNFPFPKLPPDVSTLLNCCARLYNLCIYEKYKEWQKFFTGSELHTHIGPPYDFRQVWNHPLSYAAFFWLLFHARRLPLDAHPKRALRGVDNTLSEKLLIEATRVLEPKDHERVRLAMATFAAKHRRTFQVATNFFWKVTYLPFRHARESLRTIRDVLGADLYVATEGDHETQVAKVQTCGLSDFFPEQNILSTGAAATPHEDFSEISTECEKRKIELSVIENLNLAQLHQRMVEEKTKRQDELDLLQVFIDQWQAHKRKEHIYALVMASVLTEPKAPLLVLTSLRHLNFTLETNSRKPVPKRCVMIGDRESVDIEPFLTAVNNHGSGLRYFAGRKTRQVSEEGVYWISPTPIDKRTGNSRKLLAKYAVWCPTQTAIILSQPNAWPEAIEYGHLLPVIPGAFVINDGHFDERLFKAMLWGESMRRSNQAGGATFSLLNSLRIRATASTCPADILSKSLGLRLKEVRQKQQLLDEGSRWSEYRFLLNTIQRIWPLIVNRNQSVEIAGNLLADILLDEFSNWDSIPKEIRTDFEADAVDAVCPILSECLTRPYPSEPASCITDVKLQAELRKNLERSASLFENAMEFEEKFMARLKLARQDKRDEDYRFLLREMPSFWAHVDERRINIADEARALAKLKSDLQIEIAEVLNAHLIGPAEQKSVDCILNSKLSSSRIN